MICRNPSELATAMWVQSILKDPHRHEWSIQGFGMLRLHLANGLRLHLWSKEFQVDHVSLIHTHPWTFSSHILAGETINTVFQEGGVGDTYNRRIIQPGMDLAFLSEPEQVRLSVRHIQRYLPGQQYFQLPEEIHSSDFEDGTITLNHRVRTPKDEAYTYWPQGEEWVSAQPRTATAAEINAFIAQALPLLEHAIHG